MAVNSLLKSGLVPIIDLKFFENEDSLLGEISTQLKHALKNTGIVFLVNHGIDSEKIDAAWKDLDKFCDLPEETKDLFLRRPPKNHGYVKPNQEKFDGKAAELRHSYNICSMDRSVLPHRYVKSFDDHSIDLINDFQKLSNFLLKAVATGLDLQDDFFLTYHSKMFSGTESNESTLRLIYYPAIVDSDDENKEYKNEVVTRCGAHCDYGTFTLLSQDSEGGLEVKLPGEMEWKRVGHLPGAMLLNIGEMLSIWSDDTYPPLLHRVVIPQETTVRNQGRHSMAFFCHPDNETPIKSLRAANEANIQKGVSYSNERAPTAYEYIQAKFQKTYETASN